MEIYILNNMYTLHIQAKMMSLITIMDFYNVLSSLEADPSISLLFDSQTLGFGSEI